MVGKPYKYKISCTNSRAHKAWYAAILRCTNEKRENYQMYGAKGIKVCDRWLFGEDGKLGFECFLLDMGEPPSTAHSLDRIDYSGNYEPRNCRWATATEQARNTSRNAHLSAHGSTRTIAEWIEITGLKRTTINGRLKRGWDVEAALSRPPDRSRRNRNARTA